MIAPARPLPVETVLPDDAVGITTATADLLAALLLDAATAEAAKGGDQEPLWE